MNIEKDKVARKELNVADAVRMIVDIGNKCAGIAPKELWTLISVMKSCKIVLDARAEQVGLTDCRGVPIEAEARIRCRKECPHHCELRKLDDEWCDYSKTYCDIYAECERMEEYDDMHKPYFKIEEELRQDNRGRLDVPGM